MTDHASAAELLTIDETADRLRLSKATVHRLVAAGHLPTIAVSERRRLVDADDLAAYLDRRRQPRTEEPT